IAAAQQLAQHRAARAQPLRKHPRIDAGKTGNTVLAQPIVERPNRAPMTELTRKFGNHEPGDLNVVGLEKAADAIRLFIRRDTVVADEGIGEDEDLALVRRVSERLR